MSYSNATTRQGMVIDGQGRFVLAESTGVRPLLEVADELQPAVHHGVVLEVVVGQVPKGLERIVERWELDS